MRKNRLLSKAIVFLAIFILLLSSAMYLAFRPVSYNMEYFGEQNDEYGYFAAKRYFTPDNYLIIKNTNYDIPIIDFYYYKDGYVFNLRSETKEQYAEETAKINSRWEDALKVDFYSCRISAYKMIYVRPDGAETIYICTQAIVLTIVFAVAALIAASLSCVYFVQFKKVNKKELPSEE